MIDSHPFRFDFLTLTDFFFTAAFFTAVFFAGAFFTAVFFDGDFVLFCFLLVDFLDWAFVAAFAEAVVARRLITHPSTFLCFERATPIAPAGTSSVITDPAAVYAPSPIVTGATNIVSLPIRT
jgi:hypothetical protein